MVQTTALLARPASDTPPILRVRGLAKRFGQPNPRTVFAGVELELRPGDYVAIMGESGSGKSTLLNLIAGLDLPDQGSIELDGTELTGMSDDARTLLRRSRMGFVFQAFHVLPYLDVAANVGLPLSLLGVDGDAAARRVGEMLAAVGLSDRAASPPRELSGGELQRVAIARALVHSPGLVLADEPTGNLDAESARQVLGLLRGQVKRSGSAGILVTHSSVAAASADRTLLLTPDGMRALPEPAR
ncbi:MAG TPA: ABC transporter ATP-binding protein [Casimicrobiaceae bacterium]|nr:ABC transporter ATP-binding protein [Casimicrobiaceae bacterium]